MLRHPTLATLEALKLTGMATALTEQLEMPDVQRLSFEERLGLLVDRERTMQENRRLTRRLAQARLPDRATLEDLDYRHPRGLDKTVIAALATGQWIRSHDNVLIVGPTGAGKTYLASALAQMACRLGCSASSRPAARSMSPPPKAPRSNSTSPTPGRAPPASRRGRAPSACSAARPSS